MSKTCQATNKEIHSQALSGYRTAPSGEGQGFFQEHPPPHLPLLSSSPEVTVTSSPIQKRKFIPTRFFLMARIINK